MRTQYNLVLQQIGKNTNQHVQSNKNLKQQLHDTKVINWGSGRSTNTNNNRRQLTLDEYKGINNKFNSEYNLLHFNAYLNYIYLYNNIMTSNYLDYPSLQFILHEVYNMNGLLDLEFYNDYDAESINMFLEGIRDLSDKELYPYIEEMDSQPAHYKDGKVVIHPQIAVINDKLSEMGIIAGPVPAEDGGLQMPHLAYTAATYIIDCANNHVSGYTGLTLGAAELILEYGNEELKELYAPKMLTGEWAGTMCLTEPQAGSSLSDITTSATPADDGSYNIKGQKIFISGGDHEYNNNFIHLTLARIDGAPAGTKGISLFVVPKKRIKEDGSLENNDVITAGDFQKMGQKGYCTTHLIFGEQDNCKGWLVGSPHKGLTYMFLMMNAARIAVGRGAAAIAMSSSRAALSYAKDRNQGRPIASSGKKNVNQEPVSIIEHADVRRMLLSQKVIAGGAMAIVMQTSKYYDLRRASASDADREKYGLLLEIMTPMVKTYPAELGQQVCKDGIQILGGYGFCSEYILQQYARDIRIHSLYEGTTGIQSLDLLARKVTMQDGAALKLLMAEMMSTISDARKHNILDPYASKLESRIGSIQKVIAHLMPYAMQGDYQRYTADANLFMEMMSHITIAWLWLKMGIAAAAGIADGNSTKLVFYNDKIECMKFFFKYELSKTTSLEEIIMDEDELTLKENDKVVF